jgi:natural product precursor
MKKQTKKLSLNKKTISNLNSSEMSRVIGGSGWWCSQSCKPSCACGTKNGNSCPGHNTCYNC